MVLLDSKYKIVILGCGQLGLALARRMGPRRATLLPRWLDATEPSRLLSVLQVLQPHAVINTVAYTDVEAAEAHMQDAVWLNFDLPAFLSDWCRRTETMLVHFSTDYVFDGTKGAPYTETDRMNPLNAYGQTKMAGDNKLRDNMEGKPYYLFRTSSVWTDGATRNNNFVWKILQRTRESRPSKVLDNQVMTPTYADDLTAMVIDFLGHQAQANPYPYGLYNATNTGSCSWYELARWAAKFSGLDEDLIEPTSVYPTAARRPSYSVLDCTKIHEALGWQPRHWLASLRWSLTGEQHPRGNEPCV
jgi:dTDP-4-dehydrorhamnose reductase